MSLRVTLILLGALLIGVLYLWERHRRRGAQGAQAKNAAPVTPAESVPTTTLPPKSVPSHIITLHILAPAGQPFRGVDILAAAQNADLVFGARHIFHRMTEHASGPRVLFSLASMLEPGSFDLDHIETFSTTGLVLFARLPGPTDALAMYEDMIDQARRLAHALGGEVCDERRSVLTLQTVEHTREQIRDFNRRLLLAQKQHD
ncbi:MAG: cell division protein ZipA [Proteobacteria bacterium]|nr:cell division protein ZipA [Pseudomonadota bacterium]